MANVAHPHSGQPLKIRSSAAERRVHLGETKPAKVTQFGHFHEPTIPKYSDSLADRLHLG
jgi:hypothetical protein